MALRVRPEAMLRSLGETEFIRRHQAATNTLAAFEKSEHAEDWRELMRLYLVRRTRTFIQDNYAVVDPDDGRRYVTFEDGTRSYFPHRIPRTAAFPIREDDPADLYARLFGPAVVDSINRLSLPRYGLGNYVASRPATPPTVQEARVIADLSRAGKRLMGFCRTNLFKRLESSGFAFLRSLERHVLRNFVTLHALEQELPVPIGSQDSAALDLRLTDLDAESLAAQRWLAGDDPVPAADEEAAVGGEAQLRARAAVVYTAYRDHEAQRFRWLPPALFVPGLAADLLADSRALLVVLASVGHWNAERDRKLAALHRLLTHDHGSEKVIVFSQFADTVRYLARELTHLGIRGIAGATGDSEDPTELAWRFSPRSNDKLAHIGQDAELRVLLATDVLSEGQNLQDARIVVNYDLPWAIIRLIQRVGRVDRIGQQAAEILCYSFLPADGVERIINLRARVRQRLRQNAEVVGADESFFDDDRDDGVLVDLYNESAGILDGDADGEVDLGSYAYQVWKNALDADPSLERRVEDLPAVVYSTRAYEPAPSAPAGVLLYARTAEGNDSLAWVDAEG